MKHCYWIEAPEPVEGGRIEATADGNVIRIKAEKQPKVALWLDAPLVDLAKPVAIELNGAPAQTVTAKPELGTYCDGLDFFGDPRLAAPVRIEVK